MPELIYEADGCEIWHGNSLCPSDVEAIMQGRKAQLLNVDAPYSEKTHSGHDGGSAAATEKSASWLRANGRVEKKIVRKEIDYTSWSHEDVRAFVETWEPHVSGWWASTTDDQLAPDWSSSMAGIGLYTFAPLPWVEIGSRVRLVGDGPSNWTCWLVVGRPKRKPYSNWGTLQGAYILPAENHQNRPERITGGKSIPGTVQLIEDYSRPGELVVDPCLGGGTTMIAARMCGRQCIGIEQDRGRAELCAELMRHGARSRVAGNKQESLF